MTDLSPAADAVKDAAQDAYWLWDSMCPADAETIAAAALRAAADQLVPEETPPADFLDHAVAAEIDQRRATRAKLLAIATELEGG
jgi:hypothetical protein